MSDVYVSALYPSYDQAKLAVEGLEKSDINTDNISIIASNGEKKYDTYGKEVAGDAGRGAGAGAAVGGVGGLLTGLGLMAIPGVGPIVAAGWLTATLAGAAAGAAVGAATASLVSAFTKAGISEEDANIYAEHVRRGGAVVRVKVNEDDAEDVDTLLHGYDTVSPVELVTVYQEEGWTSFDPSSDPWTPEQIRENRDRYTSR